MAAKKGKILIGTSGWQYRHWTGAFYPEGVLRKWARRSRKWPEARQKIIDGLFRESGSRFAN